MPRAKLPPELARITGAASDNPARYADQHPNDSPKLGSSPGYFSEDEHVMWAQFKHEVPWLKECHRALMELACPLRVSVRRGLANANQQRLLLTILREVGATPATEGKVDHGHKQDPYDEFDD